MTEMLASASVSDERELKARLERGWVPFAVTADLVGPPRVWLRRGARADREAATATNVAVDRECARCGGDRFVEVEASVAGVYERCPECNR